jgi:glycosyltransferase involved in cell wall biosynthesis
MRVGQLLPSVSRHRSGIFEFTLGLAQRVAESGADVRVFGIHDQGTEADAHRWQSVTPFVARPVGPRILGLAPRLLPALLRARLDVLHAHGLWTLQSAFTLAWAAWARRPYLVSVHGQMNPLAAGRSRGKKRIASAVYEDRRLRRAACLHSLGEHETRFFRARGFINPVVEIPYGVETPSLDDPLPPPVWSDRVEAGRPVLLYLGRLDPIKGLENLLRGWARARRAGGSAAQAWALVIAGWGEEEYEAALRRLGAEMGADGSIVFVGSVFAADREAAYRAARACVLPSLSEGQPFGILEAWARGRGALMTDACHLPEGFAAGAALRVPPGEEGIEAALLELFALPQPDLDAMGRRGRALIERDYAWPVVTRRFLDVYEWLAGGGAPPAWVRRL